MEQLLPLIIQLIGGAAGGNAVGLLKQLPIGKIIATIAGLVGGVAGGQLADLLPLLQGLLENSGMLGDAGASAGGGAILTLIVGLIKKAMAGSAAG